MILSILVPTDFSNDAYNALFYATQLFKHQTCTFHILHAYDRQSHFKKEYKNDITSKKLLEFISKRTAECLQKTFHKIIRDTEKNTLYHFVTVAKNDSLEKATKSYMTQNPIDLIVMGTKGRTGAVDIFFGGNTIQMVKSKINCPLLCIPKQIDYRPISQMSYMTNFRHSLERSSLSVVKSIATHHKASLYVVHISDDHTMNSLQEKNKTFLSDYFESTCLNFQTIPCEKSKAKTLAKFAEVQKIDLLVMHYYPHYFLAKLFREPVVLDLSIYTKIPILILPSQE